MFQCCGCGRVHGSHESAARCCEEDYLEVSDCCHADIDVMAKRECLYDEFHEFLYQVEICSDCKREI